MEMKTMLADYREKYREYIRRKQQVQEDGNSLNGKYPMLIVTNEVTRRSEMLSGPWRHSGLLPEQTAVAPESLLDSARDRGTTVVLGAAGVGKTTLANRIMLDWATGSLVSEEFELLFYVSCKQMSLFQGQVSLTDLILSNDPEHPLRGEVKQLLASSGKCIFIIDGFEELCWSGEQEEDNLVMDPTEETSMEVLLRKLFQNTLLPQSHLIITTRPSGLRCLENCFRFPYYVQLLGFSNEGKEEYFLHFFRDKELATTALNYVKENRALSAMSLVPPVCQIICTVLKQQLERGEENLVPVPEKLTALYALYVSCLTSSLSISEQQDLRTLCVLAVDGIWGKIVLKSEEIQKEGLSKLRTLPPTLRDALFQKDPDYEDTYRFIHLSVQEFLSALFYVLEDTPKNSEQDINLLLKRYSEDHRDLTLLPQFVFSLLNGEMIKYVTECLGWKISLTIKTDLLEWFKMEPLSNITYLSYRQLEHLHALHAIREEEFVKCALDPLTKLSMVNLVFTQMDLKVLSFCIKNALNLETLYLYRCSFLSKEKESTFLPECCSNKDPENIRMDSAICLLCQALKEPSNKIKQLNFQDCNLTPACCRDLASVISSSPTLINLDLEENKLKDSGAKLLCEGLTQPKCKLKTLGLAKCGLTDACCGKLSSVLPVNQTLRELVVERNKLGDLGVKLLCEGLKHLHCKLETLNLYDCGFTAACCGDLASVLSHCQTLRELLLGANKLGDSGMNLISEGLKNPNCKLQKLCLCTSEITAAGCKELSNAISASQTLEDIDLWDNIIEDSGMKQLCEGLQHPKCKLQILSLWNCKFTTASCRDICTVLSINQSLRKLQLEGNDLGDEGVKLICEGLKHPKCGLKTIGLEIEELSEDTVRELELLKKMKPDLIIDT